MDSSKWDPDNPAIAKHVYNAQLILSAIKLLNISITMIIVDNLRDAKFDTCVAWKLNGMIWFISMLDEYTVLQIRI